MSERRLLRRAQWWTVGGGLAAAGAVALLGAADHGLGILIGASWSALNLRALEGLLRAAVVPRAAPRDHKRVFLWSALKLGVYVLAVWLLVWEPLPAVDLALGLTIMLAALVLAGVTTQADTGQATPRRGDDDRA